MEIDKQLIINYSQTLLLPSPTSFHAGVPHLMVVTREEPPYVMVKCGNCTGKERYQGFAIDLLQAISEVIPSS